jgi:hypothetical protein
MVIVDGRRKGEAVVEKDEDGIPLKDQTGVWFPVKEGSKGGSDGDGQTVRPVTVEQPAPAMAESDIFERLGADRIIHDYWPSRWRRRAAEHVNSTRVNALVSPQLRRRGRERHSKELGGGIRSTRSTRLRQV